MASSIGPLRRTPPPAQPTGRRPFLSDVNAAPRLSLTPRVREAASKALVQMRETARRMEMERAVSGSAYETDAEQVPAHATHHAL